MGHSTPRAALIYQHATSDRDQAIAAALSELATTSVWPARRAMGARWTSREWARQRTPRAPEQDFWVVVVLRCRYSNLGEVRSTLRALHELTS